MSVYLRGEWDGYKRIIEGVDYRRPLKLRKGQEAFLSDRIAQEEEAVVAVHYGTPLPRRISSLKFPSSSASTSSARRHRHRPGQQRLQ
jgi:hypothetical protein